MPNFVSRNGKPLFGDADEFQRWNDLPYGMWSCESGRVVLFNRFYEPIIHKLGSDCTWVPADASEWVTEAGDQVWFYGDEDSEAQKRQKAHAALIQLGVVSH